MFRTDLWYKKNSVNQILAGFDGLVINSSRHQRTYFTLPRIILKLERLKIIGLPGDLFTDICLDNSTNL